jgi:hypothetical protein
LCKIKMRQGNGFYAWTVVGNVMRENVVWKSQNLFVAESISTVPHHLSHRRSPPSSSQPRSRGKYDIVARHDSLTTSRPGCCSSSGYLRGSEASARPVGSAPAL